MPRPIRNTRPKGGVISKYRVLWTDIVLGTFALVRIPDENRRQWSNEYELEPGDNVLLEIPGPGDSYVTLDITRLTSQELDFLEAFFARAIKAARPICERRDENATEQERAGNDTYSRIYRQVPQFVVREGNE